MPTIEDYTMFGDALKQSTTVQLLAVFDRASVTIDYIGQGRMEVRVSVHKGYLNFGFCRIYGIEMANSYDYANYFRKTLPRRIAFEVVELLMDRALDG